MVLDTAISNNSLELVKWQHEQHTLEGLENLHMQQINFVGHLLLMSVLVICNSIFTQFI